MKANNANRFTAKDHQEASSILAGMVGRLQLVRDRVRSRYGRQHALSRGGQAAMEAVNQLRIGLDDLARQDFPEMGISYPMTIRTLSGMPDLDLMGHAIAAASESEGVD